MHDPYEKFEKIVLDNGLTVFAQEIPNADWQTAEFVVHAGARQDKPGLQGTAHFLEHAINQNTAAPEEEINEFFADCGGKIMRGRTGMMTTRFGFFAPADIKTLSGALDILGNMLICESLDRLNNERQVIISEFHTVFKNKFIFEQLKEKRMMLYPGLWLADMADPLGWPETIGAIELDDLRLFYEDFYTPPNITVVALGGMRVAKFVDLLRQSHFALQKPGSRISLPDPHFDVPLPIERRKEIRLSEYFSSQEILNQVKSCFYENCGILPGVLSKQKISSTWRVLNRVLNDEIRKNLGLVYDVDVSWEFFGEVYEFWICIPGISKKNLSAVEQTVEDALLRLREYTNIFEKAKRQRIASIKLNDQSGEDIRSSCIRDIESYQRIVSLKEEIESLESAAADDFQEVCLWLLPHRRRTVIQMP